MSHSRGSWLLVGTLRLLHLDDHDVREAMVLLWSAEWAELSDRPDRHQCYGGLLSSMGWVAFERAMPAALAEHDVAWLVDVMSPRRNWVPAYARRKPRGGFTRVAVNAAAQARALAIGEFNTAYIRGLSHALRARGETHAVVYRAGEVVQERSECTSWEGSHVPLAQVIDGHRARYWPPPGDPTAWSLPSGPNCHHSIHAIQS